MAVLHQDSNHSEQVSTTEVALWASKLRPGGCWVADDTDWPTMGRAQSLLAEAAFLLVENHQSWKIFRKP